MLSASLLVWQGRLELLKRNDKTLYRVVRFLHFSYLHKLQKKHKISKTIHTHLPLKKGELRLLYWVGLKF